MEEDTEYLKLPIDDQCVHKLWKARVHGYEEATKLFHQADEKSPEFNKYLGLVKKFVIDSNAVAQEKGLIAVLAFVENASVAGKTAGDVMSGIVTKCIGAPKAKTKDLASQITLMYIEIEKHETVQDELLKGLEQKNPKTVVGCISVLTQALREFGSKVINMKPLIKKLASLLEDRDKGVREQTKLLAVEIYRWIGAAVTSQLTALKPVQLTELQAEFEKVKQDKGQPTRYLRSQQPKQSKIQDIAAGGDFEENSGDEGDGAVDIDPYELLDPVDIISKLPKDFYEKIEAKKWQERKEAIDLLEGLVKEPKLENGDYGDIVRALKKVISKDTNVMVVAVACKCMAGLATGLKKRFNPYASNIVPVLLDKFREKKQNVVLALREAIDAVYLSTTLEAIHEDVLAALDHKNPQVKAETAGFLARTFTKCTPLILNKKLLKVFSTSLLKTLNESDPTVRDNSAEAIGVAMKVVGEKAISPFISELDNLKMAKIKENCEKAVIVAKMPAIKPSSGGGDRPNTAPPRSTRTENSKPSAKRPTTAASAAKKKPSGTALAPKTKMVQNKVSASERDLSPEEVDERASELFPSDCLAGLTDTNWKTRLSAVEQFNQIVIGLDPSEINSQLLCKILNKKPGLKDTNFQVCKARLEAVKQIADSTPMTNLALEHVVADITDRLGDSKNGDLAADTLTGFAESSRLELVTNIVLDYAFTQKSPKVQQEALNWIGQSIQDFGFVIQPKPLIANIKRALVATNPAVRSSSINLIGILYLYMGQQLMTLFEGEKPALQQQIQTEFEKYEGKSAPHPKRKQSGLARSATSRAISSQSASANQQTTNEDEPCDDLEDEESSPPAININELMPRVDISGQITDALLSELADKNWKVRSEALKKLTNIITEHKFITPNLGELPPALAPRLTDSNSRIANSALDFCEKLGPAMGTAGKKHIRTFFPGLLQGLGDSKQWIRTGATKCIDSWGEACGYKEFFDGEMIADALKSGSPTLRAELWSWLAAKLPDIAKKSFPKEELQICLPTLYTNCEDRSADVRKNCQEAILPFMIHLGYETMTRQCEKLPMQSQTVVSALLAKAVPNIKPEKPVSSKKGKAEAEKVVKSGGAQKSNPLAKSSSRGKVPASAARQTTGARKKEEESDTSPLLAINNLKNQRSIDEHKLKVLRWNFTTPREEFVELLKDQMTNANVNRSLIANMFHSDFKYHLKAIDSLSEDVFANGAATKANLDLLLKWLTLRFFDTNPSVLIKGLEYLQTVFSLLIEEDYTLSDIEAVSFLPYLTLKLGDPKDAVRNSVKALFRQLEVIYPTMKVFSHIMEGLKSKNARQRAECLDLMGQMIEVYNISICQPTPSSVLKEVAKQISDRDNSVRNAALNCIVQAFYHEGERIYKMIGKISDKDQSLLEERLKRAAKNRPPARERPSIVPPRGRNSTGAINTAQAAPITPPADFQEEIEEPLSEEEEEIPVQPQINRSYTKLPTFNELPRTTDNIHHQENNFVNIATISSNEHHQRRNSTTAEDAVNANDVAPIIPCGLRTPRPISGPFGLDMDFMGRIDAKKPLLATPKLITFDDLDELLGEVPDLNQIKMQAKTSHNISGHSQILSPPKPLQPHQPIQNSPLLQSPSPIISSLREHLASPLSTSNSNIQQLIGGNAGASGGGGNGYFNPQDQEGIEQVNRLLQRLRVSDTTLGFEAVVGIEQLIHTQRARLVAQRSDHLLQGLMVQLKLLNTIPISLQRQQGDLVRSYKAIFLLHFSFLNLEGAAKTVSTNILEELISLLLHMMIDDNRMVDLANSDAFVRIINLVIVRFLERADHNNIICALIHLLHHGVANQDEGSRYLELVMKCTWKVVKMIPSWEGEIDHPRPLQEIHKFLKQYPSHMWKEKKWDEVPLKTIKTMVHTMVKAKGPRILDDLNKIEHLHESELHSFINRVVKYEEQKAPLPKKETPIKTHNRMSKSMQENLSEIFKKIGLKEETEEGLSLLYDFIKKHPEADVNPFLAKSSEFFQNYVKKGLKTIETDRQMQIRLELTGDRPTTASTSSSHPKSFKSVESELNLDSKTDPSDPDYYLDRLQYWQKKAGIPISQVPFDDMMSHNLQCQMQENYRINESGDGVHVTPEDNRHDYVQKTSESNNEENSMENIKQRLKALKARDK